MPISNPAPAVASEDVGGFQYQLVKLVDATAASSTRTGVAASPLQVSLANTAANATAVKVDGSAVTQPVSGTVTANPTNPATATLTQVAENVASVTVLAANANRLGALLYNDADAACYLKYGATASAASHTIRLLIRDRHEVFGKYTGKIDAIWDSAPGTGNAKMYVTELTA